MQVELPLRDGSGAAPMETDENDSGGRGGGSSGDSGGEGSGGREQVPRLDFGALPQELRKRNKKADTQFREQIDEKTAELERLAPNLKVHHSLRISADLCSIHGRLHIVRANAFYLRVDVHEKLSCVADVQFQACSIVAVLVRKQRQGDSHSE